MEINERLDKIELSIEALANSIANIIEKLKIGPTPAQKPVLKTMQPMYVTAAPVAPTTPVQPPPPPPPPPPVQSPVAGISELIALLNSKEWPHAVDTALICDISSEQDKEDRAEGILDLIIDVHLENLKFLDFGCGEGHVVNRSKTQNPRMSVGYDIKKSEKWVGWEKAPNIFFTDDWNEVKNLGPFNIVLMYDVIDHMLESETQVIEMMKKVKNLLAVNGKIYVRTHPWCSRHGTHLYHQINKAFIHMVFSDDELSQMGYKQEPVQKIITPIAHYANLFKAAGFKIHNGPHAIKEAVEPFFTNHHAVAQRIKKHYENNIWNKSFPTTPLEIQFVDYVLI